MINNLSEGRSDEEEEQGKMSVRRNVDRTSAEMMIKCIYFQHWDLAPHKMGPKGRRLQIVILLDFNKCYMVIFIKIDICP